MRKLFFLIALLAGAAYSFATTNTVYVDIYNKEEFTLQMAPEIGETNVIQFKYFYDREPLALDGKTPYLYASRIQSFGNPIFTIEGTCSSNTATFVTDEVDIAQGDNGRYMQVIMRTGINPSKYQYFYNVLGKLIVTDNPITQTGDPVLVAAHGGYVEGGIPANAVLKGQVNNMAGGSITNVASITDTNGNDIVEMANGAVQNGVNASIDISLSGSSSVTNTSSSGRFDFIGAGLHNVFNVSGYQYVTISPYSTLYLGSAGSAIDSSGAYIRNIADPTLGTHVGDRDYNDARYTLASLWVATNADFRAQIDAKVDNDATYATVASAAMNAPQLSSANTVGTTNKIHVLLYGQSNAQGTGSYGTTDLINYPRWALVDNNLERTGADFCNIKWLGDGETWMDGPLIRYSNGTFGPEFFGAIALNGATGKHIYITKVARGGIDIDGFVKPSTGYTQLGTAYTSLTNSYPDAGSIDVIWWVHGESGGTDYETKMGQMFNDIIADYGNANTRIVCAGLGATFTNTTAQTALEHYCSTNNNAKLTIAYDLPYYTDNVHYNALGHQMNGYRLANATLGFNADLQEREGIDAKGSISGESLAVEEGISGKKLRIVDDAEIGSLHLYRGGKIDGLITRNLGQTDEMITYDRPEEFGYTSYNYAHIYEMLMPSFSAYGGEQFGFFHAKGYAVGSTQTRSLSVKLLDMDRARQGYSNATIEMSPFLGTGASGNTTFKVTLLGTGSDAKYTAYGSPKITTDTRYKWIVTLNTNITASAGDHIVCGNSTHFICDEAVSSTNYFYVRYHWNGADTSSYTPVSTSTPIAVISSGVTNNYATGAVSSNNAPSDYRNLLYTASDGYYFIPAYQTIYRYSIDGTATYGWTPEAGD